MMFSFNSAWKLRVIAQCVRHSTSCSFVVSTLGVGHGCCWPTFVFCLCAQLFGKQKTHTHLVNLTRELNLKINYNLNKLNSHSFYLRCNLLKSRPPPIKRKTTSENRPVPICLTLIYVFISKIGWQLSCMLCYVRDTLCLC